MTRILNRLRLATLLVVGAALVSFLAGCSSCGPGG
jgi:hypothetical protein